MRSPSLLVSTTLGLLLLAAGMAVGVEMPPTMKSYAGSKVFKIVPTQEGQLGLLLHLRHDMTVSLQLDWWADPTALGRPVFLRVPQHSMEAVLRYFEAGKVAYTVSMDDVHAAVSAQMLEALQARAAAPPATAPSFAAAFNFSQYHTIADINTWVLALPQRYPGLATVIQVATSYERRPIYAVKVTSNKTGGAAGKPGFWMDGGIHAREWIAPATVLYMLNALLTQYGTDPTVTSLVDKLEIFVVPVFNVDGYSYTWTNDRMWRKTRSNTGHVCIGVDPNRNWDFHWGGAGASGNPCDDSYYGPKAFSETEVKTIADYIQSQTNINAYFNFHSFGQLWMSPWGYSAALPRDYTQQEQLSTNAVAALTAVHGTKYTYGPIYTTIYPASGNSADWTYGVANVVFSYGVELRDTGEFGFLLPAAEIAPTGEETFAGIKVAMQYVIDHPKP